MNERTLGQKIWAGEYEGPEGALALESKDFPGQCLLDPVEALSARSSLYHSYAGNLMRKGGKWQRPLHFPKAMVYLCLAMRASDAMLRRAGGMQYLTADQLDVRQSILRKTGRKQEAIECIEAALSRPSLKPHTHALLLIGLGETTGDIDSILAAYHFIGTIERSGELEQLVRVLRHCARQFLRHGYIDEADDANRRAGEIAKKIGARDQLIKMGAVAEIKKG